MKFVRAWIEHERGQSEINMSIECYHAFATEFELNFPNTQVNIDVYCGNGAVIHLDDIRQVEAQFIETDEESYLLGEAS